MAAGRFELEGVLIHDADLLPGSSGGPLIDSRGYVIGINSGSLARRAGAGCVAQQAGGELRCVHISIAMDEVLAQIREIDP